MLASATDAGRAFDLRCQIREQLLAWIRDHHAEALPVARVAAAEDVPLAATAQSTVSS